MNIKNLFKRKKQENRANDYKEIIKNLQVKNFNLDRKNLELKQKLEEAQSTVDLFIDSDKLMSQVELTKENNKLKQNIRRALAFIGTEEITPDYLEYVLTVEMIKRAQSELMQALNLPRHCEETEAIQKET